MKRIILLISIFLIGQSIFAFDMYSRVVTKNVTKGVKLYITYFWSDNNTPSDVTDDVLLGADVVLNFNYAISGSINENKYDNLLLNPYFNDLPDELNKNLGFDKPVTYSEFKKRKNLCNSGRALLK